MLQHAGRTYLMVVIRLPCTGSQHTVDAVVKAFQCWGCFRVYMGGGGRAPSSAGGRFEFRRRLGSGCMWSLCDVCVFCGELVRIANAHPLCMLMRRVF